MSQNKNGAQNNEVSFWERVTSWGTLIVFGITPLLYSNGRIASAVTSKQYFFIGIIDILLIAVTWLIVSDARYRFTKKILIALIPVGLFATSLTISTLFGADIYTSLYSTIERGGGLILWLHALFFAVIVSLLVRVQGVAFVKKIAQAILASGTAVAIMTFFTKEAFDKGVIWLNESAGGAMLGNSTIAGAYLVFVIFFALILFYKEVSRIKKLLYSLGILIILFSPIFFNVKGFFITGAAWSELFSNPLVLIGQARAAVIALIFGGMIAGLAYGAFTHRIKWVRQVLIAAIVGIVITLGYGASQIFVANSSIQNKFVEMVGPNRLIFWEEAFQGIAERPVIGWGPENFGVVHYKYFDERLAGPAHGAEIWVDKPHNIFIEILVGQGWLGLITYLVLIAFLYYVMVTIVHRKIIPVYFGSLFIGAITAYVIQNQFAFDSIVPLMAFCGLIGILIGYYTVSHSEELPKESLHLLLVQGVAWAITGLAIVIWISSAYLPSRKMIAAKKVFDAPVNVRTGMYQELFSGAGSVHLKTGIGMIYYTLATMYLEQRDSISQNPQIVPVARAELKALLEAGEESRAINKNDYRLIIALAIVKDTDIFLAGKFSQEDIDTVFRYLQSAIEMSPKNPLAYLLYSKALLYIEKIPESRIMIDKAIELNPTVKEAHDQKNAFERAFGTRAQQRDALENAQKYVPGYVFE